MRGPLLHPEPPDHGAGVRRGGPRPLGHREQPALAAGRELPRGRMPRVPGPLPGQPERDPAVRPGAAEARDRVPEGDRDQADEVRGAATSTVRKSYSSVELKMRWPCAAGRDHSGALQHRAARRGGHPRRTRDRGLRPARGLPHAGPGHPRRPRRHDLPLPRDPFIFTTQIDRWSTPDPVSGHPRSISLGLVGRAAQAPSSDDRLAQACLPRRYILNSTLRPGTFAPSPGRPRSRGPAPPARAAGRRWISNGRVRTSSTSP